MDRARSWLLYGANGYTGALIAREARRRGLSPILAGRSAEPVQALAAELGLEARVFGLDDARRLAAGVRDVALVLNCAGPFSATAAPMIEACLAAGAHYLDITGEIDVLERAQALDARARAAGIVLCPGVGFDVIPTDCVAAALKQALPDATRLALGFDSRSGMSPGTAKTSIEGLAAGGRVRRDGRIVRVPLAWQVRRIDFGDGAKLAMTIPWGDVATAFHSTGIGDVRVFMAAPPRLIARARRANLVRPLLGMRWVQRALKARVGRSVAGPSQAQRDTLPTWVWGEATNAHGERRTARIRTANGYRLTIDGALHVVDHVLAERPAAGAWTPSRLLGAGLVGRLPGSGPMEITADQGPVP